MLRAIVFLVMSLGVLQVNFSWGYDREIYISSTAGDDSNPGTREKPKQTINGLTYDMRQNSRILLKRGDVFFGYLKNLNGCEVSAYGKGEAPVICGFRVLKNPEAWNRENDNIWSLDLAIDSLFCGISRDIASMPEAFYDGGSVYDSRADRIFGHMVKSMDELSKDGDFFTSNIFSKEEVKDRPYRKIYFYSSENPQKYGNLCFSVYEIGASGLHDTVLNDIAFVGFGRHGVALMEGCEINNCRFDIIGGAVQIGYSSWVRYGNGVEAWAVGCNDNLVADCTISRTYDCATTIQGSGDLHTTPSNIRFVNNKILHCRQAFEYFLKDEQKRTVGFDNCEFSGNICYMMGDNGFDSPEKRDADILCYSLVRTPIPITRNIFYGAPYLFTGVINQFISDNIVYIYPGQYLRDGYGGEVFVAGNPGGLAGFRKMYDSTSEIIVVEPGSKEDLKIKKKLLKQIGWKAPSLHLDRILK